jgi:hypothetical protein
LVGGGTDCLHLQWSRSVLRLRTPNRWPQRPRAWAGRAPASRLAGRFRLHDTRALSLLRLRDGVITPLIEALPGLPHVERRMLCIGGHEPGDSCRVPLRLLGATHAGEQFTLALVRGCPEQPIRSLGERGEPAERFLVPVEGEQRLARAGTDRAPERRMVRWRSAPGRARGEWSRVDPGLAAALPDARRGGPRCSLPGW